MENFKYHFDDFTFAMYNMAYIHFTETDKDYIDIERCLNNLEKKFDKLMDKLNKEDQSFLIDYIDKFGHRASCNSYAMYLVGYKDCVKVLKEIGAI